MRHKIALLREIRFLSGYICAFVETRPMFQEQQMKKGEYTHIPPAASISQK
jgi:hypothetical protein